jgi:myo-inositol-1(or 4)-monophosphatase
MKEAKNIAIKAAREAGKIIRQKFGEKKNISFKDSSQLSIVTKVDTECQKIITSILKETFPDYNILGEEAPPEKNNSEYTWIIDPIDGTYNFAHQIPLFVVSVALKKNDDVILAVCYDPIHDELFYAEKGMGAYLNDKKIQVSGKKLAHSSIGVDWGKEEDFSFLSDLQKRSSRLMGYRSTILELCYVAVGRIDGLVVKGLDVWDLAPSLLVTEAGGKITALDGSPFTLEKKDLIASNGVIHDELVGIVNKK